MLWAATLRISLSSSWSQEARFADEFTLDQLKLSSKKAITLMSYCLINFSTAAILISLISLLAHPPIWHAKIFILPSSLSAGKSFSWSTLYFLTLLLSAFVSILTVTSLSLASVLVSCHSLMRLLISWSERVPFLFRAAFLSRIYLISKKNIDANMSPFLLHKCCPNGFPRF